MYRILDSILHTKVDISDPTGMMTSVVAVNVAKLIHETGASSAQEAIFYTMEVIGLYIAATASLKSAVIFQSSVAHNKHWTKSAILILGSQVCQLFWIFFFMGITYSGIFLYLTKTSMTYGLNILLILKIYQIARTLRKRISNS